MTTNRIIHGDEGKTFIKCMDCGALREVDAHNADRVIRCRDCQYKALRRYNTAYRRRWKKEQKKKRYELPQEGNSADLE